ncbi:MAG: PQQ-dependent sugar dehydrogenase [Bacteroidota bacterium]
MKRTTIIILTLFALLGLAFVFKSQSNTQNFLASKTEKMTIKVDTVLKDLSIPWGMDWLPNGDMLFTERGGELRLVQKGKLHPKPIGNLPEIYVRGQGGLLDVKVHPKYAQNGWIYLAYSSPKTASENGKGGNTTFMRAKLKDHTLVEQKVLLKAQPNFTAGQHFGGRIEFDREGYIYLTVGDRGGREKNQRLSNYRGKVFRLHDDGRVPADNPFVNEAGAKPETFTYGHRNPQGIAIHPQTGDIWTHEHGPRGGDELNLIQKGKNYGWPTITYGINYSGTKITDETHREGMEQPITYWVPSIAPCGMAFVSSNKYPEWKNNLLVGSLKFRYLKRLEIEENKVTHEETILEGIGRVRAIEQGPDGYVYVAVESPGMILRLRRL